MRRVETHPMLVSGKQRRFLGSHNSASSRAECAIVDSIKAVDRLVHAVFLAGIGSQSGVREVMNILQLACACPCRDVHSQLWWGRLLQEGAVRSEPGGVLVRWPAWRRTDGLQDPWQPWLWYDQSLKTHLSHYIHMKKKCLSGKWNLRVILKPLADYWTSPLLKQFISIWDVLTSPLLTF